jgi:predicted RNA-binding protein Jag
MEDILIQSLRRSENHLRIAVGQLGSYESLVNYLIDSIRGKTANTPEHVADYVERRQNELVEEQYTVLFNRKKESTCTK